MQGSQGARLLHLIQNPLLPNQVHIITKVRQPKLLHGQVLIQVQPPGAVQQRFGHQAGHSGSGKVLPTGEDATEKDQDEVSGRVEDVEGGEEEQEVRVHSGGVLHVNCKSGGMRKFLWEPG